MNPELLAIFQQHGITPSASLVGGPHMIDLTDQIGAQPLAGTMPAPSVDIGAGNAASGGPGLATMLGLASQLYNSQRPTPAPMQGPEIHAAGPVTSLWDALGIHPALTGLLGGH